MEHASSGLPSPIFLLGTQRSGTTLLTRILSAHPDIFIQNELPLDTIFTPGADVDAITANTTRGVRARGEAPAPPLGGSTARRRW